MKNERTCQNDIRNPTKKKRKKREEKKRNEPHTSFASMLQCLGREREKRLYKKKVVKNKNISVEN